MNPHPMDGPRSAIQATRNGVNLLELFDLDELQALQDGFADATHVAAIITQPDGTPITRPSNFCRLCAEVIRGTDAGLAACMHSDAVIGSPNSVGPTVQTCLSGGLWDAGASIIVDGEHIANWLIGQVRMTEENSADMSSFARSIGADEDELMSALAEVPQMSEKQFRSIADFLFVMAGQLSRSAYQNLLQARLMEERERVVTALEESEHRYRRLFERSPVSYQSLDADGRFLIVNSTWLDVLGYSEDEVLGNWFGDFLAPAYRDIFKERFPQFMAAGKIHTEFEMVCKTGEIKFVGLDGVIGLDANGEFQQTHCVFKDITEERRAASELESAHDRLEHLLRDVVATMGKVVEARDPYTQGHETGVAKLAGSIAREMGLTQDDVDAIEVAALVHDIGKLSVPAEILTKPGKITAVEFAIIKQHPQAGYDILKEIDFGWPVAEIALQHHERMDGTGYPNGLLGDETLFAARVIAVADVVEAMASHRPYRAALGLEVAIDEIKGHAEKYDAEVVAACVRLYEAGAIEV